MNTQTISESDFYNVQSNKINGDKLNASEWNSLSNAVRTSHERINSLVGDLGEIITTLDEEDLTSVSVDGTKDKTYNPLLYSGLGKVYLRKNIVEGVNTLTQDMFYKDGDNNTRVPNDNTIYVIQYDFTLGEDITIPANCVLEFNGGSLRNRTITGNNTVITTNSDNAIFNNITGISGTFDYTFKPEHFAYGLSGDCFDVALAYLKTNAAFLEIGTIRLKANLDLKGVWFKAKEIQLNAHDLYLGGGEHQFKDKLSEGESSYNQYIDFITTDGGTKNGNVIIEKCYSIKLYIGHRDGDIIFQTNTNNGAIAYSEFTIKNTTRLVFRTSDGYNRGWINENRFVLQRVINFIVESSLWSFNHNFIYGGCFEGSYNIRLEVGRNNHFYDIRNEGKRTNGATLYFGIKTRDNIYETQQGSNGYIYNYGYDNVIIADKAFYADTKLHEIYSIEDAINSLPTRFKNLSVVDESTNEYPTLKYLKPNDGNVKVYESPFLKVENNFKIYNILEVTALNEPYLYPDCEFYDENLKIVSYPAEVTTGGLVITNSGSYTRNGEGTYGADCNHGYNWQFVVSNYRTVYRFTTEFIYDKAATNPACAEWIKKVKYYKVSIKASPYHHSDTSKILTLNFKLLSNHLPIYPITSNLTPSIYFGLTNLTCSKDLYLAVNYGENFEAIITPNEGYSLPASIPTDDPDNYVMSGETKLVQGTDFDWDAQTGTITINNVTKPCSIHLAGTALL